MNSNKVRLKSREKAYRVNYKGTILPHYFYADFVVFGNIHVAQAINYLKVSSNKVALIVNFGEKSLTHQRVAF